MTDKVENKETLVVKKALRVVNLADIKADPSYQREVKPRHKTIVVDFNEDALGVPLVAERGDGTLWIVDGYQRITALAKMGRTKVRAEVFASDGPEYEANVFKLVNMARTKLTAAEQFKALLTSQDETAWAIKECVEKLGFVLRLKGGRNNKGSEDWRELTCHTTLLNIVREKGGIPSLSFALTAVKECWPGDKLATYNTLLFGLSIFYQGHEEVVDLDRLYPRLRTVTPQRILYQAGQLSLANNRGIAVCDVIEKVYRKRLGRGGKT